MNTPEITALISAAAQIPLCFAEPEASNIIDTFNPVTQRGHYSGENLAEIRLRYPAAQLVNERDWIAAKSARQDAPGEWLPITEERYEEMLCVLPPAARAKGAFLVGEAQDHHAASSRPRFDCFREQSGQWHAYSRPMTHKEFVGLFGPCSLDYS